MTNSTGMQETFITKIEVQEVRGIQDFTIPLSEQERKHLIITGKNGSGKTSLLEAMRGLLSSLTERSLAKDYEKYLGNVVDKNNLLHGVKLHFTCTASQLMQDHLSGKFLLAYFGAKHTVRQKEPTGISHRTFALTKK